MDEELKGRVEKLWADLVRHDLDGLLYVKESTLRLAVTSILALVVAERDSMKEAAAQHPVVGWDTGADFKCACGLRYENPQHWIDHIIALTLSTAPSREREIAEASAKAYERCARNLAGHPHFAGVFIRWAEESRLSASSQPKGASE